MMRNQLHINEYTSSSCSASPQHPRGFTLVEMLVAVGLLLLLMSILAQVFAIASTAMRTTRGIANNDQRSRILYTVIDRDLSKISYKALDSEKNNGIHVASAYINEGAEDSQEGYIYISENKPEDDTDDVLAFTVDSTKFYERDKSISKPDDKTPYYGKATKMEAGVHLDQPDWDDGLYDDNSMSSPRAEILYFLRKGILYRQVFLVRNAENPRPSDGSNEDLLAQPAKNDDTELLFPSGFYGQFSLSGYHVTSSNKVQIHGTLKNKSTGFSPMAKTTTRTGFHHGDGKPLEGWLDGSNERFIGRFNMSELSDAAFTYPVTDLSRGALTSIHNSSDFNNKGKLSGFETVSSVSKRTGADILITNVLSFDVKVWDDERKSFENIGHAGTTGDFRSSKNKNSTYGPKTATTSELMNNVYDTWHGNQNDTIGTGLAPYPQILDETDSAVSDPWSASRPYSIGDKYYPGLTIDKGQLYFEVVTAGSSDVLNQPDWANKTLSSGDFIDGTVVWRPMLNMKPLKGMKITIRFQDSYTGQVRQMAIVHSFAEN